MRTGRPTKYKPEFCDIFIEMSRRGCSRTEFCAHVGIGFDAFLDYQKKYTDFSDAVKMGVLICQSWWEIKGRENMENGSFNYTGWYMNMKNRFRNATDPWTDSRDIKHSGGISISSLSDEELDNRINSLINQLD